jgi:hypothetical protein
MKRSRLVLLALSLTIGFTSVGALAHGNGDDGRYGRHDAYHPQAQQFWRWFAQWKRERLAHKFKCAIAEIAKRKGYNINIPGCDNGGGGNDGSTGPLCMEKLESCFPGEDLAAVFDPAPFITGQCEEVCATTTATESCSFDQCVDRCAVAFEILPPPCE